MNLRQIEDEALHLSEEERAELAQKVLLSLDAPFIEEIEEDWLVEAPRRARELDEGTVQAISAEEVRKKITVPASMSYGFYPAAEAEHLKSVAFFESKRPGLGASYLAEFERVMRTVCEVPHSYPV